MKNEIFMFFNKPDDSEAEISRSVIKINTDLLNISDINY